MLRPLLILLFLSSWLERGPRAMVRETGLENEGGYSWILPDGEGGVFVKTRRHLFGIDSLGGELTVPNPRFADTKADPVETDFYSAADGALWYWNGRNLLQRYSEGTGWMEMTVSPPGPHAYDCRVRVPEKGKTILLCSDAQRAAPSREGFTAELHWPRLSPWKKAVPPPDTLAHSPDRLWAFTHDARDTLALFLESDTLFSRTILAFSLGPLRGSLNQRESLPTPTRWIRRSDGRDSAPFQRSRAVMLAEGGALWISLGELIYRRTDTSWTIFYWKGNMRPEDPPTTADASDLSWTKPEAAARNRDREAAWRIHPVSRTLPYLYTAYLVAAAYRSGPGWGTDAMSALAGSMAGGVIGTLGFLGVFAVDCPEGCESVAAPFVAFLLPIVAGEIWALQRSQPEERRDRTGVRIGSAALGSLTGAGIYFLFPTNLKLSAGFGALGMIFGSVVGYRLAFY